MKKSFITPGPDLRMSKGTFSDVLAQTLADAKKLSSDEMVLL